jgi:hypothetical protein
MQAYRIYNLVIAADVDDEAREFYRREIGGTPPDAMEELSPSVDVRCKDGTLKTIRDRINEEMDARNDWLRMGIPANSTGRSSSGSCRELFSGTAFRRSLEKWSVPSLRIDFI